MTTVTEKFLSTKKIIVGTLIVCVFGMILVEKFYYYVRDHPCPDDTDGGVANPVPQSLQAANSHGDELRRRLPGALVIGIQKSGTGALLKMLNLHPDVKIALREVHFFDLDENYSRGMEWYRRQMPLSLPNQITIEKTPGYCDSDVTPERVRALNPDMKILVIVREPTTRAISQYVHILTNMQQRGVTYDSFENLAMKDGQVNADYKCIKRSIYVTYMARWLDFFPRNQIHIVNGDTLVSNPTTELKKVETFLGLKSAISRSNFYFNKTRGFYCMTDGTTRACLQRSKGRKHPEVNSTIIEQLHTYFRPYNTKFQELFGQEFNWS
ncbi:heparan sulfate glucosamine 3-O-sulfotransferase 1-like [Ptychodera flava]|uniref:heparan sulfate glucosamine 3-O-sulfotransferase 1-like n=1 Tax=Ptychodera flava TaxID=63121 RepID=UPI00396A75A4